LVGDNGGPPWTGPTNGFWRDADWLFCRDGKWRPVEPGTFPLVDGTAFRLGSGSAFEGKSRQGMLKAYGNAVDAEATREFIEAAIEREVIDLDRALPFDHLI
jgi:DNA (cytosine-5)-methyltransferase 1